MVEGVGTPLAAVAASLRRERTRAGLSLAELARRAGVAKSTLSQLEAGTGNPSLETLWALGVALNVPFARLAGLPKITGTRRRRLCWLTCRKARLCRWGSCYYSG